MKTQLGSHKIGKCLLASALIGGVAFAGAPTITMTAFADEPASQTTDATAKKLPVSTIADTCTTASKATDTENATEHFKYFLTGGQDSVTEVTWNEFCDKVVRMLSDPASEGDFLNETNNTDVAQAVMKLFTDAGDNTVSMTTWDEKVAEIISDDPGESDGDLDGIDIQLLNKVGTYNGGTITDFGTYVSFSGTFKVTSSATAYAVWELPKEYVDQAATIVNSGMLAPEAYITSGNTSDDEEQAASEDTADGTEEAAAEDEAPATQQAKSDDDEDSADEKPQALDVYLSEDGKSLYIQLPQSDDESTVEGTIAFAAHTDLTKMADGTVLTNYFNAKDSDGNTKFVKDPQVESGELETKKYDKANVGYRDTYASEKFTITFDSQGGTEVAAKEMEGLSETLASKFSTVVPTKSDATFAGWYLDKEATKPLDPFQMKAEDITAYAKWQVNSEPKVIPASSNTNPGTPVQTAQTMSSTGDELPAGAIIAGFAALAAAGAAAARRR